MNYKDTLNLPRTAFPMKANLPVREAEIQAAWEEMDIYREIRQMNEDSPLFILHDGPPYANESIHLGTALNKILKDFIVKTKTMSGFNAPYIPGWDCHGLPIELQAMKKSRGEKTDGPLGIRARCRKHAEKFVNVQKQEFKRLGVFGDWENPYLTMSPEYEAAEIGVFRKLYAEGFIYRGKRPIHWCPSCSTALAEAEIEYSSMVSPSIYIKFRLNGGPAEAGNLPVYLLVWTTTPWTLIANTAVALHPDVEYVFFRRGEEVLAAAAPLAEKLAELLGAAPFEEITSKPGRELAGLSCRHPFIDRDSRVVCDDFVSREEGTGCVHSAPGHGKEDFEMGKKYGLPVLCPVDEKGRFTEEAGEFAGRNVFESNEDIIKKLDSCQTLVSRGELTHSYPGCWRCKKPLIIRTTEQWFVSVSKDGLRGKILEEIERVRWIPSWGKTRISAMIRERPDWCISRQRLWGVPIPVFYCGDCGEPIADDGLMAKIQEKVSQSGTDIWFEEEPDRIAGGKVACGRCGSSKTRKETDILDVWFDSGVSSQAVLRTRKELGFPADIYLEGTDQHRGWFQTSLLVSSAVERRAPYATVLTHGFMVDGEGKKMSKSIGNLISANELVDKYGADIVRLWICAEDYKNDIRYSPEIIEGIAEAYRRFRNTARYVLGNLYDFSPEKDAVAYEKLPSMERYILHELGRFTREALDAYEKFEFHKVYHAMHDFCAVELSAFYFDIIKDRLYTLAARSRKRRSSQTVLHRILEVLARIMAPVLPHTCEEIWSNFYAGKPGKAPSVHLCPLPSFRDREQDDELAAEWSVLAETRKIANKRIEEARAEKILGNSLQAALTIKTPADAAGAVLRKYAEELAEIFIVSEVRLEEAEGPEISASVEKSRGEKCPRCWKYVFSIGENARHPGICSTCAEALEG